MSILYINAFGQTVHQERVDGISPLSTNRKVFKYTSSEPIQMVAFRIAGNDAFFIDKVHIFKNGQALQQHGEEGGTGWCLSTDQGDGKGVWGQQSTDGCQAIRGFMVEKNLLSQNVLAAKANASNSSLRQPRQDEQTWVYANNESRREINAEGLGRCYDIRNLDPINWSNETLQSGQRASVIRLVRDDGRRPARHNNQDYVVPKGVVFTSEIIGDSEAESKFAATAYEYENEVLQSYTADIGIPKVGSSKTSAAFKDASRNTGSNTSLYAFSKMYKQFYKLDLYFDDPAHQHYLDPRFWMAVNDLGQGLSAADFIKKFGTHYASTTYYGGNFFQRRNVQTSAYSFYESNEKSFKTAVEGTIKKVKFDVGTTQGSRNSSGRTEKVEMSSAKIYTVGGDLDQFRPDLWAQTVLQNLAVIKVRLTRLSDLLTAESFPGITNIREKRALLAAAITLAEKEAAFMRSTSQTNDFFTKKAAKFKLTVTYMKCLKHGSKEPGGNSEYYGKIRMGLFNSSGKALKTSTCFDKSSKNYIDLARNQSRNINKSVSYTVNPKDLNSGFASVYGHLNEKDFAEIKLSTFSYHDAAVKINYRSALFQPVTKRILFTSTHGDQVEVHYQLQRI
ncbi:MAG: hypothetical protein Sapg2KO_36310 [Saprospiraceae bacterium]